jgi:drug/metabolite transporter (DMT)-like permease
MDRVLVTIHLPGMNGSASSLRPPAPRPRRRPAPLAARVAGRWFQALTGIAVMVGLGAAQFVLQKARGQTLSLVLTFAAFVALGVAFFFVGRGIIHGRRWAWRAGAVLGGTLLIFLCYAVSNAPQPMGQKTIVLGVTALLFGTPVILLGLPSVRRYIAETPAAA